MSPFFQMNTETLCKTLEGATYVVKFGWSDEIMNEIMYGEDHQFVCTLENTTTAALKIRKLE